MELLGFLLPPFLDILNRKIKDSDLRWALTVVVCTAIGVVLNIVEHNASYAGLTLMEIFSSVAKSAMVVFGTASVGYKAGWENSDLRDDLGLNAKTLKK